MRIFAALANVCGITCLIIIIILLLLFLLLKKVYINNAPKIIPAYYQLTSDDICTVASTYQRSA